MLATRSRIDIWKEKWLVSTTLQSLEVLLFCINRAIIFSQVPGYNDNYVCAVFVSYVEIYNNYCYDLLEPKRYDRCCLQLSGVCH